MPRYHFNVHDGTDLVDTDGTELPDLTSARKTALVFAAGLLADHRTFWDAGEWHMDVTDEQGLTLFRLTFVATDAPSTMKHPPLA